MRTKLLLMTLAMCFTSAFCISAQERVSIQDKLTKEQKQTLEYTKDVLKKNNNKIALPLELNALLGDTVTNEQYKAEAQLDEAYFETVDGFKSSIIVPLTAKTENGDVKATLNIMRDEKKQYFRIINTLINYTEADDTTSVFLASNIGGIFLHASVFKNGELSNQIKGVVGMIGVYDGDFYTNNQPHLASDKIYRRFCNINVMKSQNSTYQPSVSINLGDSKYIIIGSLAPQPPKGY